MIKNKIGVYKAIISRRSIRRFKQKKISLNLLKKFVNAARLAPTAANLQPLEYFVINEKDLCNKVFETLSWAGYIKPKWIPSENERPVAYIVVLVKDPENKWYQRDASLSAENIILTAEENGIGSCILCNVNRKKLKEYLKIPNSIIIDSVIALGYKAEKSVIEKFKDSIEYWRDDKELMHVPKKNFKDIIHINKF
jgi:nitroreductase